MANTDWGFFVDIESKEMFPPEEIVVFTVEYTKQEEEPIKIITITPKICNNLYQFAILFTIFIIAKFGCIKQ